MFLSPCGALIGAAIIVVDLPSCFLEGINVIPLTLIRLAIDSRAV